MSYKSISLISLHNSFIMYKGQMTLLGAYDYDDGQDLSELTVATELVSSSEIGGVKPEIFGKYMLHINLST